jgi:hypothetical protein
MIEPTVAVSEGDTCGSRGMKEMREELPESFDSFFNSQANLSRKLLIGHEVPRSQRGGKIKLPEQHGSVVVGTAVHFGPIILYIALLTWSSNSASLLSVVTLALPPMLLQLACIVIMEKYHPAASYPPLALEDIVKGSVLVFCTGVALGSTVVLLTRETLLNSSRMMLTSPLPLTDDEKAPALDWSMIPYAVLFDDFVYYCYHRFLSHSEGKRSVVGVFFHSVHLPHHLVKALDFWRGNLSSVLDTAVLGFQIPLGIIAVIYRLNPESTIVSYLLILLLQGTHYNKVVTRFFLIFFLLISIRFVVRERE